MPTASGYRAAPDADMGTPAANAVRRSGCEVARFPTRAVAILSLAMTVNSYAMVSLFPYVGMMVKELLSLPSINEAGFYAGYLASVFIFGRFLSGYVWGYWTDSIGRKPVIIAGLLSVATFSLAFGFSTSYTWAVSWRLILGLTNGNVPALRSSISEVCGPEHVVVGMTYIDSGRAISMVFGTGLGGLLAQPAVHFSEVFSTTGLFGRYPYLLPNLVGACYALFVLALAVLYLPETKDYAAASKQRAALQPLSSDVGCRGNVTGTPAAGTSDTSPGQTPATSLTDAGASLNPTNYQPLASANPRMDRIKKSGRGCHSDDATCGNPEDGGSADGVDEMPADGGLQRMNEARGHGEGEAPGVFGRNGLLATPNVKTILVLGCAVQAVTIGFEEVFPLFALSTPDVGGLGWNTLQVGTVLVVTGVLMSTVQLVFFPPLIKVVGIAAFQRLGFVVGIPAFLAVPVIKMLSWNYPSLFAASVAANAFVLCSLWAVNLALAIGSTTTVPSRMRGKLGGMFHTAESLGRSIGPAGFAVAYAWSISTSGSACAYGWVNHGFVFQTSAVMLTLCAALAWATLTAENLMKWEDDDEAAVGGSLSGDQSDSAACPLPPVGARSVHTDDVLFSTAVVEVGRREADLV